MNNTFRILHTEASNGWGGQEIRILQESKWLAKRQHRVFILCPPHSGIYEKYIHQKIPNLSIHTSPFKNPLDPMEIFRIYRFIRREKIDIVHTHSSIDSWNASIAANIAKVHTVRSRHVSIPVKNFFPRNFVYWFPDGIITSGRHISEIMTALQSVSADKVVSIPAGVDTKRFRPNINASYIRDEFRIPQNAVLVGNVAIIRTWKGHPDFIEAAEIVLKKNPKIFFLIVGNGPGTKRIKRIILKKNLQKKIIMTGYREDIPEIINSLDILVLSSTAGEATSQVIPQAWACKTCVLATTAGGISEIVRHNENGLLVPPSDPEQMAKELHHFIDSPELRSKLAESGYSFTMKYLSEEEMMEKTLSFYRKKRL